VLRATLIGCRAVRHPHTTWLLDDGRRPEVASLAAELGARYLTRPDNRHAKAGNINHALSRTGGELVAVLDADHVPLPDFLDAVVGYFDDDDVALVQTPHEFFNADSIQHSASASHRHEQSLFFRVICPGKDRHNSAFWCGSAAVLRRRALESVGGVRCDTIAEDFHTTIALHQQGWRTRYHHETLVQGRAPHDLASFLLQRDRWARGNLRVLRTPQNPLTASGLSPHQRISYAASLSNYAAGPHRLVLLGVLAGTLLSGRLPMVADPVMVAALWLPWTALSCVAAIALARGQLGWRDTSRFGLMTLGIYTVAFLSLVRRSTGRFKVTPKEGEDTGGSIVVRQLWLVTALGATIALAAGLRVLEVVGLVPLTPMPTVALVATLVLAGYEVGQITVLLVRLVGRRQLRTEYRLHAELAGRLGDSVVRVVDVTPTGLGVLAPGPCPVGSRVGLGLHLPTVGGGVRDVEVAGLVRSCVDVAGGTWRIGMRLDDLDDHSRDALTEYCYVVAPALAGGHLRAEPVSSPAGGGEAVAATG
jgi:cellulose synthase (UDP-forming)